MEVKCEITQDHITLDDQNFVTFGLRFYKKGETGDTVKCIHDITPDQNLLLSWMNIINNSDLDAIHIDDVVEDIIISINKNGIFVGLSLTSTYMTIPFENDVDDKFINHYRRDIEIISSFLSASLSNKNYQKQE